MSVSHCIWGGGGLPQPPEPDCIKGSRFMFESENDTKRIISIIGPQNVGPLEPLFDHDM